MEDRARIDARDALLSRLRGRAKAEGMEWLDTSRRELATQPAALAGSFAAAGRRLGRGPLLDPAANEITRLFSTDGPVLNPWRIEDAARSVLLLEDCARELEGSPQRALALYFQGELGERIAVLRSLALLPPSDAGLEAVRDALRANAADLFAAAICENAYTSSRLDDELFFQAVLKCLFLGLRIDRIEDIERRTTPELSRMLFAYVTEREHASRGVAAEVWPVIAQHPPAGLVERIERRIDAARDPYERERLELARARTRR